MKLKTTLNGQTFAFRDIRDVLAKANEPKAADRLQGVAFPLGFSVPDRSGFWTTKLRGMTWYAAAGPSPAR